MKCGCSPTLSPTALPTLPPTATPTTAQPSALPTSAPSGSPTVAPTAAPTAEPSAAPTRRCALPYVWSADIARQCETRMFGDVVLEERVEDMLPSGCIAWLPLRRWRGGTVQGRLLRQRRGIASFSGPDRTGRQDCQELTGQPKSVYIVGQSMRVGSVGSLQCIRLPRRCFWFAAQRHRPPWPRTRQVCCQQGARRNFLGSAGASVLGLKR